MSACSETRRAIIETIALDTLAEEHLAHAAQCPRCGALLGRVQQLDRVTKRTRRALEDEMDLSPASWVRIREGVDRAVERRHTGLVWTVVAATAALAVVLGVSVLQRGHDDEGVRSNGMALNGVVAPETPAIALAPEAPVTVLAAAEAGHEVAVAPGDVLAATDAARTIDAFGRHHLTLAPGTTLRVGAWTATKMVLEVVRGEVTCDVNRALDEDIFEVHSGDVTVHVLGTVFSVARNAEGVTRVEVTRGRVGVVEGIGAMHEVAAGLSLTVPALTEAQADPSDGEAQADPSDGRSEERTPRQGAHRGPRIIQIDVPDQQMAATVDGTWTSSRALKAIVKAIDDGNCRSAMKALDAAVAGSQGMQLPPAAEVAKLRARCAAKAPR